MEFSINATGDVFSTILKRRSIDSYDTDKISKEEIEIILCAAMHAPSYRNRQPWQFIVLTDPPYVKQFCERIHDLLSIEANTIIIICCDTSMDNKQEWWVQDCSAATQNMLLAACGLGLGSNWYGLHPVKQRKERVRKYLSLPRNVQPFSLVTVGLPKNKANELPKTSRYSSEKIHFNKW